MSEALKSGVVTNATNNRYIKYPLDDVKAARARLDSDMSLADLRAVTEILVQGVNALGKFESSDWVVPLQSPQVVPFNTSTQTEARLRTELTQLMKLYDELDQSVAAVLAENVQLKGAVPVISLATSTGRYDVKKTKPNMNKITGGGWLRQTRHSALDTLMSTQGKTVGITQEDLAGILGYSIPQLSSFEKDEIDLHGTEVGRIKKAFDERGIPYDNFDALYKVNIGRELRALFAGKENYYVEFFAANTDWTVKAETISREWITGRMPPWNRFGDIIRLEKLNIDHFSKWYQLTKAGAF